MLSRMTGLWLTSYLWSLSAAPGATLVMSHAAPPFGRRTPAEGGLTVRLAHTCDHYFDLARPLDITPSGEPCPSLHVSEEIRQTAAKHVSSVGIPGKYVLIGGYGVDGRARIPDIGATHHYAPSACHCFERAHRRAASCSQ